MRGGRIGPGRPGRKIHEDHDREDQADHEESVHVFHVDHEDHDREDQADHEESVHVFHVDHEDHVKHEESVHVFHVDHEDHDHEDQGLKWLAGIPCMGEKIYERRLFRQHDSFVLTIPKIMVERHLKASEGRASGSAGRTTGSSWSPAVAQTTGRAWTGTRGCTGADRPSLVSH